MNKQKNIDMHIHILDPNSKCSICNGSKKIIKIDNDHHFKESYPARQPYTKWEKIKRWFSKFLP